MNQSINEPMIQWIIESMNQLVSRWINESGNQWINDGMYRGIDEPVKG